jgi:hypothetical protein
MPVFLLVFCLSRDDPQKFTFYLLNKKRAMKGNGTGLVVTALKLREVDGSKLVLTK